jgi:hypothetical protein
MPEIFTARLMYNAWCSMHGNKGLLAGNVSIITSALFMGTTVESLALYTWEQQFWHYDYVRGKNCGMCGTIYMETTVEILALRLCTWEQL